MNGLKQIEYPYHLKIKKQTYLNSFGEIVKNGELAEFFLKPDEEVLIRYGYSNKQTMILD